MEVAVLPISMAVDIVYNEDGSFEHHATTQLLDLLSDGFTVYVGATRPHLYPDNVCWFTAMFAVGPGEVSPDLPEWARSALQKINP